jgi:predicted metalloprotease
MDWEKGEESQNLEDRRGMSPQKLAIGGGIGAVAVLLIAGLLGLDPQKVKQFFGNAPKAEQEEDERPGEKRPGEKRPGEKRPATPQEERSRKFASTILRFTEVVWEEQFRKEGKRYVPPHMVLFTAEVDTGCGRAPSAVGPFYCPADRTVYLDPTFFDELEQKLGGSKAEFSQAYVIAHEVGHHVQNLLGYSRIVEQKRRTLSKKEFNKWSVRLELQADYLAGVWAYYGQKKFHFIEPGDIESAIKSANAIGDDRLQKRARGFTSPESYTHGTSEQRVKWFRLGLETGDLSKLESIFELPYDEL